MSGSARGACPDDGALRRFLDGAAAPEQEARVDAHLSSCAACAARLEALSESAHADEMKRVRRALSDDGDYGADHGADAPLPEIEGYTLEFEIHRGGQGVVYSAIQERTGRRVAVKLLLTGAYSSRRQRARFEREVDLAASLQHPNIVSIFDRGDTRDGRSYFVMELVDGRPLDRYMAETALDVRARLGLFVKVCRAVSAAHQKGVIHRDLKPGNILIDGAGEPRVLDFGLAKSLPGARSPSAATAHTETGEFMGTLAYASPEQARGEVDAIDVRSDVYALGVILYETLTGARPFATDGPLHEVIERIVERDAARPSSVRPGLDRDLDAITLKALEKDRDRRYQAVVDLISDVNRFLNDQPVSARNPSVMYQLRKFARRRRPLVLSAAAAALALAVGGVATVASLIDTRAAKRETEAALSQSEERRVRAEAAEGLAERRLESARVEAEKQRAVSEFLRTMLASADPSRSGPDVRVLDVLDGAAARVEADFAPYPEVRAALHATLGNAYWSLGVYEKSEAHLRAVVDSLRGVNDADEAYMSALNNLASALHKRGDLAGAEALYLEALQIRRGRPINADDTTLARYLLNLGSLRAARGDRTSALALYEEAMTHLVGDAPATVVLRGQSLSNLAQLLTEMERFDDAAARYEEALAAHLASSGPEHPDTLACLNNIAQLLRRMGRLNEAEARLRELLSLRTRVLGERHQGVGVTHNNIADILRETGRHDEALRHFEVAHAIFRESYGDRHVNVATVLNNIGVLRLGMGEVAGAEAALTEAHEIVRTSLGEGHWMTAAVGARLAECAARTGRTAEARTLLGQCLDTLEKTLGPGHSRTAQARALLASLDERAAPADHPSD